MTRIASRTADSHGSSVGRTGATLISEGERRIGASRNIEHWQAGLARWDAEVLLAFVLDMDPEDDMHDVGVGAVQRRRFEAMVARRVTGEPVNYITGRFVFSGLELAVRRGVFSPRSSSEFTVERAVALLRRRRGPRVAVDLATGAGAIALAIAHRVPSSSVWGLDISAPAVRLGRLNARRLQLDNVRFAVSDMLDALPSALRGTVDVFTIHPPYVSRSELSTLPVEIRRFEPRSTLTDGSDDGLGLVRRLVEEAPAWLRPRGAVLIEVAPYLARPTATLLRRAGFADVRSLRDRSLSVTRVVTARR